MMRINEELVMNILLSLRQESIEQSLLLTDITNLIEILKKMIELDMDDESIMKTIKLMTG